MGAQNLNGLFRHPFAKGGPKWIGGRSLGWTRAMQKPKSVIRASLGRLANAPVRLAAYYWKFHNDVTLTVGTEDGRSSWARC